VSAVATLAVSVQLKAGQVLTVSAWTPEVAMESEQPKGRNPVSAVLTASAWAPEVAMEPE
jgi:hypothetical protein